MIKMTKIQNLFLISIHRRSLLDMYDASVKKLVSKKIFEKINFTEISQKEDIAVWGLINTEENYKIWKQIQKSDTIIFFNGKKLFSKTKVIKTIENKNLPEKIWKQSSFLKNRSLLIFLEKVEPIELEFNSCIPILVEPKISKEYFFPIKKIETRKKQLLESTFGNLDNAIKFLAEPKKKNTPISEYLGEKGKNDEVSITLKPTISKQRIGQKKFSKNVLSNYYNKCAICKISDIDLLQAGHIIPVENEKVSGKTENGICFCSNCHKMFDKGFFSFNNKYEIIISRQKKISKTMLTILKNNKIGKCKKLPSKNFLGLHRAKFGIN